MGKNHENWLYQEQKPFEENETVIKRKFLLSRICHTNTKRKTNTGKKKKLNKIILNKLNARKLNLYLRLL